MRLDHLNHHLAAIAERAVGVGAMGEEAMEDKVFAVQAAATPPVKR